MERPPLLIIILLAGVTLALLAIGVGVYPFLPPLVAAILCVGAALLMLSRSRLAPPDSCRAPIPTFALLGLIIIGLLFASAAPIPGKLDILSGFNRHEQNNAVREAIQKLEGEQIPAFSLSRNRAGTLRIAVIAMIMFATIFLSAALIGNDARVYIRILIVIATVVAVAGFLHQWIIPAEKTIWWYRSVGHGRPVGAFVNRTHHAGFLAMLCPLPFTLMLSSLTTRRYFRAALGALSSLIILFCVTSSLSRGAFAACVAGVLSTLTLYVVRRGESHRLRPVLLSIACGIALVAAIRTIPVASFRSDVTSRLHTILSPAQMASAQSRVSVWKDALRIWTHYPITGVGANGFRMIYPQYRERTDRRPFFLTENEYVELLVDGGAVGVVLVSLLIALLIKRMRQESDSCEGSREISLAVAGASIAVAFHACVDFPLHAPLYSFVFASLVGLALGQTRLSGAPDKQQLLSLTIPLKGAATSLLAVATIILLLLMTVGSTPYNRDLPYVIQSATVSDLVKSLGGAPTSPHIWHYLGLRMSQRGNPADSLFAEHCIDRATKYDPNNYLLWEALGGIRRETGDIKGSDEAYARMTSLRSWKVAPTSGEDQY